MQNWFENHPIGKMFTPKIEKYEDSNMRYLSFIKELTEGTQVIKFYFPDKNYIQPSVSFILDLKNRFLTQEQQLNDVLANKFMFRFHRQGFFYNFGQSNQSLVFEQLGRRWSDVKSIAAYFDQLNEWIDYVLDNVSTPDKINNYFNYRQDKTITFNNNGDYSNFNIAAIVQDPNLAKLYQQAYDALPIESDYARNKLKQYYEQDIVEISQIVAAKND